MFASGHFYPLLPLMVAIGLVFGVAFHVDMFFTGEQIGRELMESFKHHDLFGSFDRNTQFQNNTSGRLDRIEVNNHEFEGKLLMRVMAFKERYEGLIKFLIVAEGPM